MLEEAGQSFGMRWAALEPDDRKMVRFIAVV
jgi:hypothetical protein